jgi:hypothetical protein
MKPGHPRLTGGSGYAVCGRSRRRATCRTAPQPRQCSPPARWCHRARYVAGKTMRVRWVKFIERKKKPFTANVAIARELVGKSVSA